MILGWLVLCVLTISLVMGLRKTFQDVIDVRHKFHDDSFWDDDYLKELR